MRMNNLVGTGVALITPFKTNSEVDEEALIALVKNQIKNGVDYLVVLEQPEKVLPLPNKRRNWL